MSAAPGPQRGWTIPPRALDTGLAIFCTFVGLGSAVGDPAERTRSVVPVLVGLAVVSAIPVAFRRAYPPWVLVLCQAGFVLRELVAPQHAETGSLGVALAMYAYALTRDRDRSRRALLTLVAVNVSAGCVSLLLGGGYDVFGNVIGPSFLVTGGWALGDNVRTRRAYLASLEERAARLEREREEQAERAVVDERARIARELHDVVAHHVSAIAVTAGAAEEIAEREPAMARAALQAIRQTSRDALGEMRAIVGVLAPGNDADLAPQPGLGEVERLVTQTRAAGMPVTLRVEGTPRDLPEAVDLSAYRIVQEALTNALKHARGASAEVVVRWSDDAVELMVADDGRGARPTASVEAAHPGRGLIGMRERVALFRGELAAGPNGSGGFVVRARLPLGRQPP